MIAKKYQWLKCYRCGNAKPGQMTICENKRSPERDDAYGKDGYSACCTKEACLAKIEVMNFFEKSFGKPSEKKSSD